MRLAFLMILLSTGCSHWFNRFDPGPFPPAGQCIEVFDAIKLERKTIMQEKARLELDAYISEALSPQIKYETQNCYDRFLEKNHQAKHMMACVFYNFNKTGVSDLRVLSGATTPTDPSILKCIEQRLRMGLKTWVPELVEKYKLTLSPKGADVYQPLRMTVRLK